MAVPVGLNVWARLVERTFPYLDRTAAPFDSLWMPDHVQYGGHPVAEGWTLMTWALARYPDKRVGHEVLCNSFRNPAHTAKMVATAQALSGGRAILGIGAGWNEEEYRAYGWPFPPTRVRIAQLAEAIQLIRHMWTESPARFKGQFYEIAGAVCEPRPQPMPPVMVGGHGEKYLLRVVAEHADWWNYSFRDMPTYVQKQEALLIADNEGEIERVKARPGTRPLNDIHLIGTPAQVTEAILAAIKQGARRLTVNFADVPHPEGAWLFSSTVLPHLR